MEEKTINLEADYFIIGAGASGIAFADELINGSLNDITVIIVDKHAKPGGHWNDAYDFVTLHQPAAFYGVNSKHLGQGGKDLASLSEICSYYELVMKDLVASGRVQYFPQCVYTGNGIFHSMLEHELVYKVKVLKKTVDATYLNPSVPSKTKPEFKYSEGVNLVPVNEISQNNTAWKRYVIIGGGKTGIDSVLFLLKNSVKPERITWIIPNDYWLLNRNFIFTDNFTESSIQIMNCVLGCETHEELFKRWEKIGWFLRLDKNVEPKNLKGGSVNDEELEKLRLIKDVIRKGRVDRIEANKIVFKDGSEIDIDEDTLNVDCTSNGSGVFTPKKVFNGETITLQDVRQLQAVYSASLIAAFEARFPNDEEKKNRVLKPIFHCQTAIEYVIGLKDNFVNENAVADELGLCWLRKCRLNSIHHISICSLVRYLVYIKWHEGKLYDALDQMINRIESLQLQQNI